MYQALYRKYRPRRFSDVAGQQHITETLLGQIKADRLTHAYLFVGTRGTGKTSCAKILSRAVNCLNPVDGNPCNECPSCTGIENGTILDVIELDAASNNGVDDVRAMREEAIYSPSTVKKRVYIVDEVHMLSTPAFNALLKILEEPPKHIMFILATTEMHKVLPTIQSRCQKFMFRRLTPDEIAKRLCEIASSEGLTLLPEAASMLAALADGSMRDGISLLDQCASGSTIDLPYVERTLGLAAQHEILDMVKSIADCDTIAVLEITERFYKDGKDMAALLSEVTGMLRDLLVVRLAPGSSLIGSSLPRDDLACVSDMFAPERLLCCLEIAKGALLGLPRTGISRLVMEMCFIRMSEGEPQASSPVFREPSPIAQNTATQSAMPQKTILQTATPQTPPAPPPAPKPASAAAGDILSGILGKITDMPLLAMLGDSSKVRAEHDGNTLVIYMANTFNADIVRSTHIDTLTEAAEETLGKGTAIRIENERTGIEGDKQSKLNDLLAFGDIVKVE